jgi:hypothetical protein
MSWKRNGGNPGEMIATVVIYLRSPPSETGQGKEPKTCQVSRGD